MTSLGETALSDLPSETKKGTDVSVDVDQFLAELSNAAASGATDLPSADIPANTTTKHHIDPQVVTHPVPTVQSHVQQALVPPPPQPVVQGSTETMDVWTLPVLSGLLFVLVQQPSVRKQLVSLAPSAVGKDGNLSIQGLILIGGAITGIVYGVQEYVLDRSTSQR